MARERPPAGPARRRLRVERVASAGGVVYRSGPSGLEVVLCGRDDGVWGLPKGTPEQGESFEDAAVREVSEETGLQVAIQEPLGSIRYWFSSARDGVRYDKTVHYYLMTATGGSVEQHDWEFDRVEWLPVAEALRLITYRNEREMLEKAALRLGVAGEGGGGVEERGS